jgi:hypothetical protein
MDPVVEAVQLVRKWWITKHDLTQPQFGVISQNHPFGMSQSDSFGHNRLFPQIPPIGYLIYTRSPKGYMLTTRHEIILVDMNGVGG